MAFFGIQGFAPPTEEQVQMYIAQTIKEKKRDLHIF